MKKIAIVTKYMMAGGIEKALINMLNTFSKEKYDVTLYVEKLGGDFFEDIPSYVNVKVIPEIECGNKERIGSALKSFKIGRSIEITAVRMSLRIVECAEDVVRASGGTSK